MGVVRVAVVALAAAGAAALVVPSAPADSRCPVSTTAPVPGATGFNVGTARLAVSLPQRAKFVVVPDGRSGWAFREQSGRIRIKLGWLSPSGGPRGFPNGGPLVTGRRLDQPAAPLMVSMGVKSFASGGAEFYPSHMFFPSNGCWRITARNAEARLTFTVRLVRQ